jgi:hydroxymethylglutaryl-CoA lyase
MLSKSGLPSRVTVYEVGLRDGLQNEAIIVPTQIKAELAVRLMEAGLPAVEITSMVRPDLVPALSDADELLDLLGSRLNEHRTPVLVPNMRGLERAVAHGAKEIAVFASATESFASRNLNMSIEDSLTTFQEVVATAAEANLRIRGYISMCWGDPWEGHVNFDQVLVVAAALRDFGVDEISLGDTIGTATPGAVVDLLDALERGGVRRSMLAVHFHDTYGQALANTLAALLEGVTTVDASISGLGGCPFARSATGNLATEDLVWMLDGLGIDTGIDINALVATSKWFEEETGIMGKSRAGQALSNRPTPEGAH